MTTPSAVVDMRAWPPSLLALCSISVVPPVPVRWRRRMIAFGSGDPTRTICSTLIAQAFHSVPYPILPRIERIPCQQRIASACARDEILHIRHHSLFAPRDFDLSPYFQIVKPTIGSAFDPHKLRWAGRQDQGDPIFDRCSRCCRATGSSQAIRPSTG